MPKIYLSPAVHEHDRQCVYDAKCSENTHANLYLDELVAYLNACGIEYKRHDDADRGDAGVSRAVKESNAYSPDLHYVVHTNAFDGTVRGSRPQVYKTSAKGRQYAETILKYRRMIYPYPCTIFTANLQELRETKAPAVYEELVFHDNPEDCAWLHQNMRKMAEYTCRAFCEIFGVAFTDPYLGDVNGDGKVNAADALLALQDSVKLTELSGEQKDKADMNNDGRVDAADALEILQKSVGR